MKMVRILYCLLIIMFSFSFLTAQVEPVAEFYFNGNLNNETANGVLTEHSNTLTSSFGGSGEDTYWEWSADINPGGGLILDLTLDHTADYSIGVRFQYETVTGWKKIIDYSNATSDNGFYFYNGMLSFYNSGSYTGTNTFFANTIYDLVVTRDAAVDTFTAYVVETDGTVNEEFSVDDDDNGQPYPVGGGVSRFGFFFDDNVTNSEWTPSGRVYSIKVWDSALSPEDIGSALDEPAAVIFTDGAGYNPGGMTSGQTDQAFGRFSLSADIDTSLITGATITLNGERTGASNLKLWSSLDETFNSGSDIQLGSTIATDTGNGNTVSFTGFSDSIKTTAKYYFISCDLAVGANGLIQGVVENNGALTIVDGVLSASISNAPLSGGDVSLPVELTSFTANAGDGLVTLKWTTASEVDNEAFLMERSADAENFELLAEIKGQGSTSSQTNYSFTDNAVFNGFTYYYRLADRDINGVVTWHTTVNATPNAKGIDFEQTGIIVEKFALHSNYPNPFNPETTIRFDVPTVDGSLKDIKLNIYNSH